MSFLSNGKKPNEVVYEPDPNFSIGDWAVRTESHLAFLKATERGFESRAADFQGVDRIAAFKQVKTYSGSEIRVFFETANFFDGTPLNAIRKATPQEIKTARLLKMFPKNKPNKN